LPACRLLSIQYEAAGPATVRGPFPLDAQVASGCRCSFYPYFGVPHFSMQQLSIKTSVSPRASLRTRFAAVGATVLAFASNAVASPPISTPAPDFALRSLGDANVRLSEHLGSVVLINFWATWCGPCRQEMPLLDGLYGKYQRAGLVMLGINIDEDRDDAVEMAQTLKVTYPILFDERKDVSRAYRLGTMPLTVLIDREGVIRYVSEGFKPGYEKLYMEKLRELLGE
jgi:thiol-disulfide isomerase/thioredoxin